MNQTDAAHPGKESRAGPRRSRSGRWLTVLLSLVIGLVVLGIWLYVVGPREILGILQTVALAPALLATLAWVLAVGLRSYKWHLILVDTYKVPPSTTGRVYWASSFLNTLFPFRVGELARSLFLKQLVDMPIAASLPSVLVDRLYSIAVILLGLLFLPLTGFGRPSATANANLAGDLGLSSLRWGLGILAGGFLAALVFLFALRNHKPAALRLAARLCSFLPGQFQERLLGFLDTLIDRMQIVRSDPWSMLALLAWSLAVLWADALKDHLILRAFGLNVPLPTCFMAVSLTNLAFILPSPPGNIGSSEWYATLVYATGFGFDSIRVAAGAIFGHAMTALVVAAGGAFSLSTLGLNLAEGLRVAGTPPPAASQEEDQR